MMLNGAIAGLVGITAEPLTPESTSCDFHWSNSRGINVLLNKTIV